MNQNLFNSELLSLLSNTNITVSDGSSGSSSLNNNNNYRKTSIMDDGDDDFQDKAEKQFLDSIPQLGLYFETKEKITNNSSLPNEFLQYNFIRVSPLISQEENKSLSLVCDGSIIKISKPQDEKSSAEIEGQSLENMKNNLYNNFGVENRNSAKLVTYQEEQKNTK